MSGIEVAGLVLGGFPILLNMLDYYKTCFQPLEEWWKFRREFVAFIDDISQQKMLFEQNLEALLAPIIDTDEEMTRLLQKPTPEAWKQRSLNDALVLRLSVHHERYFRLMERMLETIQKLYKLLGIQSGQVCTTV